MQSEHASKGFLPGITQKAFPTWLPSIHFAYVLWLQNIPSRAKTSPTVPLLDGDHLSCPPHGSVYGRRGPGCRSQGQIQMNTPRHRRENLPSGRGPTPRRGPDPMPLFFHAGPRTRLPCAGAAPPPVSPRHLRAGNWAGWRAFCEVGTVDSCAGVHPTHSREEGQSWPSLDNQRLLQPCQHQSEGLPSP